MSDELFAAMRQAVIDGDAAAAAALAEQALADGVPPLDAIDKGFVPGLSYVGEQFGRGELFLPDMMLAARAMQKAIAVLEPELARQAAPAQRRRPRRHRHGQGRHPRDRQEPRRDDALDSPASRSTTSASTWPRSGSSRRPASTTRTSSACRRC